MISRLFGPFASGRPALGLLLIRLVFGSALALHGWPKAHHPASWMGAESPVPAFFQFLAALSEFGGGLSLIAGLLTPLACFGILCTMGTAFAMVHLPKGNPFVANGGPSYETVAFFAVVALGLIVAGPGALSLDALIFGRRPARLER